jgi:hypothetical protein
MMTSQGKNGFNNGEATTGQDLPGAYIQALRFLRRAAVVWDGANGLTAAMPGRARSKVHAI